MKSSSSCSICGLRVLSIFFSLVTIILLVVSITIYGLRSEKFSQIRQCVASSSVAEEKNHSQASEYGFDPFHFSTTMKFMENDIYQDLSHENDHYWQELLTPNGGFLIKLDEEGNAHRHGIGMFHQLHCLQMIRQALQARGGPSRRPYAEYTRHGFGEKEDDGHDPELHMLHCLDYLRQTVMCLADDTIEPPKRNSLGRGAIDGMITHQCRDSRPLYDMSRASPEWYRYASDHEHDEVRDEDHHH